MIRVSFSMPVAKTPICPIMYRFPFFLALYDHNPLTLQINGQTDVMLIAQVRHANMACHTTNHLKIYLSIAEIR